MITKVFTSTWIQTVFLITLLCMLTLTSFSHTRWRQQIRNFAFDQYNIIKPRVASDAIAVVDIDEASLKHIGQMPWPRSVMADLVTKLRSLGARVVTFDIVFAEPDRLSPKSIAEMLPTENLVHGIETLPDNDVVFGNAIKDAGNVVTGFSFTNEKTASSPRQKGIFRGKNLAQLVPSLRGATTNLKPISKYAAGNGSFFVSTDTDVLIRRVPMLVGHKKPGSNVTGIYPSLSLETIRVMDQTRGGKVKLADHQYAELDPNRFGIEHIQVGKNGRVVPTNPKGEFLVYFAPSNKNWYVPAHSILDGTIAPEAIKDKIILIGTSAVGLKDIRSTPLNAFIPGVEVHLNIIDQIIQKQFLTRSVEAEGVEAVTVFIAGLFIIVATPFIGAVWLAIFVSTILFSLLCAGWFAFTQYGLLIDVAYPALSILVIFSFSVIITYLRAEKDRKHVRQAFGQYISPEFMEELTKDPDKLKLGGEIRDLTVMFTDIRKFTTISEGLTPEELIQLMNDFLTPMSDLVMRNRGTIDKYMGDAMMAFWNAPLDDNDHARNACIAALGMQAALKPINEDIEQRAHANNQTPVLLNAGIGINTGPCAVGNMGSKMRFDYSALGDAVNIASRLEGQTKTYGVPILIGQDTFVQVSDFAALEVDLIAMKGKTEAIRVYALLDDPDYAATPEFKEWAAIHQDMIHAYREKQFEKAITLSDKCKNLGGHTLDDTYALYKKRCNDMIKTPPGDDWNGVYIATEK